MTDRVASCDLRPHRTAQAALREVGMRLADQSHTDIGLLLVLDTPQSLAGHALAYEELWRSRRVSRLLTVLVGPLVLPGTIEVPGSIGTDRDSGVIWVGDPVGVDWALSAATVSGTHQDLRHEAGLAALLSLLAVPAVFERVVALVAAVPDRVVSPGLHVFEATADELMFLDSMRRCISGLLDADTSAPEGADDDEAAVRPPAVCAVLIPGGRLASIRDHCIAEAAELAETAGTLSSAAALYGSQQTGAMAMELAVGTGTALREYRVAVQALVAAPPGEKATRLRAWGVQRAAKGTGASADIATLVTGALAVGEPLPVLSRTLRDRERDMRANSDLAAADQLDHDAPPAIENRLLDPRPMAGPQPWLIAAGAVAVAVAGLGQGYGILAGLVTALAWLGLTGLTVARAPGGRLAAHRAALLSGIAAAVAGLAVGVVAAEAFPPPATVAELGVAVGLCISLAVATLSWRARAQRWSQALRIPDVLAAAGALTEVVIAVASREWSAMTARQDALTRARSAVDGVAGALRASRDKLDQDLSRDPARRRTRHELDVLVGRGLARLVQLALEPTLGTLASGSPQEHEERAHSRAAELLRQWDKHVYDGHSPLEPPSFLRGEDLRGDALSDDDIAAMREVIATQPTAVMWQLCQAHDTGLLDPVASETAALRFAPRSARTALGTSAPAHAEWLSSGALAGVLRLVPVRGGVVRRTWSTGADPADDALVPGLPPEGYPNTNGTTAEGRTLT